MTMLNPIVIDAVDYKMNSPLLFETICLDNEEIRSEILDVMPTHQQLLDVFSGKCCKLYLPACFNELIQIDLNKMENAQALQVVLRRLFKLTEMNVTRLNLLLLWDLPNYLDPRIISELILVLLPHLDRQAHIHFYLNTQRTMPAVPSQYRFAGSDKVRVQTQSTQTLESPGYYKEALEQIFEPFIVKKSILLSSGVQEYLLILP